MSFFPRAFQDEFATFQPLFRLADDYSRHIQDRGGNNGNYSVTKTFKSFSPKVDVKELPQAYEIHAELPGIEQKNIDIEFTDSQTLTIKGRTEHVREEGTRPSSGYIEGSAEQGKIEDSNNNNNNKSHHQPTVEDENASSTEVQKANGDKQVQQQPEKSKYWVSERSVGEFARTFSFPARVDQDNVKASLKDGILSIVVPKAPAPSSRKINIE